MGGDADTWIALPPQDVAARPHVPKAAHFANDKDRQVGAEARRKSKPGAWGVV